MHSMKANENRHLNTYVRSLIKNSVTNMYNLV